MKKNIGLICVLIAILLFVVKELNAQCDLKGKISYTENQGYYSLYFSKQPWTGCNGYGLGWTEPKSISARWTIYCEETGEVQTFEADVKDTLKFQVGGKVYVTAKVVYTYEQAKPKTVSPFPIWFTGMDNVTCFKQIVTPPDTTLNPITPILPGNSLSIQNGIISATGSFGVLTVFTYPQFAPVQAGFIEFQDNLMFFPSIVLPAGSYFVAAVFKNPHEYKEIGVVTF